MAKQRNVATAPSACTTSSSSCGRSSSAAALAPGYWAAAGRCSGSGAGAGASVVGSAGVTQMLLQPAAQHLLSPRQSASLLHSFAQLSVRSLECGASASVRLAGHSPGLLTVAWHDGGELLGVSMVAKKRVHFRCGHTRTAHGNECGALLRIGRQIDAALRLVGASVLATRIDALAAFAAVVAVRTVHAVRTVLAGAFVRLLFARIGCGRYDSMMAMMRNMKSQLHQLLKLGIILDTVRMFGRPIMRGVRIIIRPL